MTEIQQSSGFDEFWRIALRKVGRRAAEKEFYKALKRVPEYKLMAAWEAFNKRHREKGTEAQFICHPRTWLCQGRWDDVEDDTPERKGWVPVSQMTDGEKRRTAELLKKPYMKPEMLRLGPRSVAQLKAEGYL